MVRPLGFEGRLDARLLCLLSACPEGPVAVSAALGHALNIDMLNDAMVPEIAALLVDELSNEIID